MDERVKQYLGDSDVLIVDEGMGARVGMKKALVNMGASIERILLASSVEEAEELIRQKRPRVVFCDFEIRGKSGLALLQAQRAGRADGNGQDLFVLVASNTSQSTVAQAAEEDVDAYILKPYTLDGLHRAVKRAVLLKIQPPEYLQIIEVGKMRMDSGDLPGALEQFRSAMQRDPKPALACFYEGLAQFRSSLADGAQFSYKKGLTFNTIHYKCLVGLFDLLMAVKRYGEAYEVVKRIAKFFPSNPERLSAVLWLAVQTGNYKDVEAFYQDFTALDRRSEELIRCVCAALIVCARHFFGRGEVALGVSMAEKAAITAAGRDYLLRKTVEALLEGGRTAEAGEVLKRFSRPGDNEHAVAEFLVAAKNGPWTVAVDMGMKIFERGHHDEDVYKILVPLLRLHGMELRAEDLEAQVRERRSRDERKAS